MARVGALITPFVAQVTQVDQFSHLNTSQHKKAVIIYSSPGFILQVMLESSVYLALSVYCCCCLLAAVASCALPIETTGRGLQESSHREWGQEMVGRASSHSSARIPQSSPGSQGWGRVGWSASERGDRGEEKRQGEAKKKKLDQLSVSISSPILWLFSLGTTVASKSQAAQIYILLLYSLQPPLLSQFCHWLTKHGVTAKEQMTYRSARLRE